MWLRRCCSGGERLKTNSMIQCREGAVVSGTFSVPLPSSAFVSGPY